MHLVLIVHSGVQIVVEVKDATADIISTSLVPILLSFSVFPIYVYVVKKIIFAMHSVQNDMDDPLYSAAIPSFLTVSLNESLSVWKYGLGLLTAPSLTDE